MTHIKLPTSFFDNDKLKAIRGASKDGNLIILLYTMLITVAAKSDTNGQLMLCEDIPYDNKILSGILGFEEKIVKDGLEFLTKFGLLTVDNNIYSLIRYDNFIDSKGTKERKQNADRQARFKAKIKEAENSTMQGFANILSDTAADTVTHKVSKKTKATTAEVN